MLPLLRPRSPPMLREVYIHTPSNHSKAFDNTLTLRPPRLGFIDRLLRRYCIIALDPSPTREARTTRPAKPVLSPILASPIPARNSFNFLRFRQNCSYPSCPANLPYNCETALSFPAPYVTTLFPFHENVLHRLQKTSQPLPHPHQPAPLPRPPKRVHLFPRIPHQGARRKGGAGNTRDPARREKSRGRKPEAERVARQGWGQRGWYKRVPATAAIPDAL